jgi:hypothetical protein
MKGVIRLKSGVFGMNIKKLVIVLIIVLFALTSTACEKPAAVTELSDDEVFELYIKAKEAYEWFDLTTIPYYNDKYIEVDGQQYYEVIQPGIDSKKALEDYLNELFTDDITENLMDISSNRYVEHENKLYVLPADRGTDIFKGAESYEVTKVSDEQIKFTVKVEVYDDPDRKNVSGYEEYDFCLEFLDGKWRFTNFELVR